MLSSNLSTPHLISFFVFCRERLTQNLPNLERTNSRGDLRADSDEGLTSDDAMTDNDDSSASFETTGKFYDEIFNS